MANRKPSNPKPAPPQIAAEGRQGRRSTGPVTPEGKAKSAGNALTHGATSPKLLNDEERDVYQKLVVALQRQYPSKNPLVHMQLERISRLKVQLDRIQSIIDASFVAERIAAARPSYAPDTRPSLEERSIEEINWRIVRILSRHAEEYSAWLDQFEQTLLSVCQELNAFDGFERLTTHSDFQRYLPNFCDYLLQVADGNRQDLKDAVAGIRASPYAIPDQVLVTSLELFGIKSSRYSQMKQITPYSGPPQDISAVSLDELWACAIRLQQQMATFLERQERAHKYESHLALQQEAVMPDPEKLDRLMRYQTTINRQLSSAMGELLELMRLD